MSPDLDLLYFAPCDLYEGIGGSARLKDMTSIFQRLGVNIRLISYITKDEFRVKHERISASLSATKIYVSQSSSKLLKALAIPLILLYGLKNVKKSKIIFAHAPGIMTGFPAMIIAKMFNKPLIIDHMDVKDPDTPRFIYDMVLRGSNIVFTISHYLEEEVKNKYNRKAIYIPIFIDTKVFQRNLLARKKIRKKLKIGEKDILIGYVGSFWYVEGVPFLLKAFKNLIKKYENIRLILIGNVNVHSDNIPLLIEKLSLREKTILIPQQPRKSIPNYLSACDVLCSPKIDCEINRAANPVKVIEYLSMSLPVICSAVGGIVDAIKDKYNGRLVKPGIVEELEEKLEWVILYPEQAKEMGKKGRKTVIEKYSHKAIKNKIKRVFNEISEMTKDMK